MIRAIAIDDEPLPLELLEAFCSRTEIVSLERTFTKVGDAQAYLERHPVDLLFLDIQMPNLSGIDFFKGLKREMMVIFTTAYSEYAVHGFDLLAVDYLLKPFSFARFEKAVQRAEQCKRLQPPASEMQASSLKLRMDNSDVQVALQDIDLIESFADYLEIHQRSGKTITVRMPLKTILEKLPAHEFVRVHRSFIVPFRRITKVGKKTLFISGREIPIGDSYKQGFLGRFLSE